MPTLKEDLKELFLGQIASKPSGYYAHIVTLRLTESYPVFRTDEGLNIARVASGRTEQQPVDRITMFMRKQTTPERLRGRELLRHYAGEVMESCSYNEHDAKKKIGPCGQCPDCVTYGFAIGESGAEKAKVFGDTAYSLTGSEISSTLRTFNAPNESGIMYDPESEQTSNRINSTEYALPGLIFPSVTTLRDMPFEFFAYILNNILTTPRYGAITTRTGRVENRVQALVFADGEIMSNLALTQALYDALVAENEWKENELVDIQTVERVLPVVLNNLLAEARVRVHETIMGENLQAFMQAFDAEYGQQIEGLIADLFALSHEYRQRVSGKKGK